MLLFTMPKICRFYQLIGINCRAWTYLELELPKDNTFFAFGRRFFNEFIYAVFAVYKQSI